MREKVEYQYTIHNDGGSFIVSKSKADGDVYEYGFSDLAGAEKFIAEDKAINEKFHLPGMKAARYIEFERRIGRKIEALGGQLDYLEEFDDPMFNKQMRQVERLCHLRNKVERLYYSRRLYIKPFTVRMR